MVKKKIQDLLIYLVNNSFPSASAIQTQVIVCPGHFVDLLEHFVSTMSTS